MFMEGSNDEQQFPFKSNPILLLTLVFTIETQEKTHFTTALILIGKLCSLKQIQQDLLALILLQHFSQ